MNKDKDLKSVGVFLIITFILSSICYYIRIKGGDSASGITAVLMWCPTVAALIVNRCFYHKEKILGWHKCEIKYLLAGIIIPIIYLTLSYGFYWLINKAAFTGKITSNSIGLLLLLIPSSIITAAGEEIGWRGFLLPRLTELYNVKRAILFSGLIWSLWHFPLMIAGLYETSTAMWYQLPMFTVSVILMSAILAYLRLKSESVWPAILLHASHNYVDQVICGPLTNAKNQAYFVGETGFLTILFSIIIVIFLFTKFNIKSKNSINI